MDLDAFTSSLDEREPPAGLVRALQALWYQAKGEWNKAHALVKGQHNEAGVWVHGFLHRLEGDTGRADYWYRRAGKPRPAAPISQEWREIVLTLL